MIHKSSAPHPLYTTMVPAVLVVLFVLAALSIGSMATAIAAGPGDQPVDSGEGSDGSDGSGTKLGITSFDITKIERIGNAYMITMSYDASQAGNPWQGGIYGYGEIEKLTRCEVTAYFYKDEDAQKASELAARAKNRTGFNLFGKRDITTWELVRAASYRDNSTRMDTAPHTGQVKINLPFPYHFKYLKDQEKYQVVFIAVISYNAFNGAWTNVDYRGPVELIAGEEIVEVDIRIGGPSKATSRDTGIELNITGTGETTKVDRVSWRLYYSGGEGLTTILTYNTSTIKDIKLGEDHLALLTQATLQNGRREGDNKTLYIRAEATAYADGEPVDNSNIHQFKYYSAEEISLTLTGPDTIKPDEEKATFTLRGDGKDLLQIKEVRWILHYMDQTGAWIPITKIVEPFISDLELNDEGTEINLKMLRNLAETQGTNTQGAKALQMKIEVSAYSSDLRLLSSSNAHEFNVQGIEGLLTLKHFHPLQHFKAGTGKEIKPAGDLVATLKDQQNRGIEDKLIYYYVDRGTQLYGLLLNPARMETESQKWWEEIIPSLSNAGELSYLGHAYTEKNGEATYNYLLKDCVMAHLLAKALVQHQGKVTGTIWAVAVARRQSGYDTVWEVENRASVSVEFDAIAQILDISGQGQPDSPPPGQGQYTVSGPGQVRVKRLLFQPNLDLDSAVREGFKLMPADIINIDGATRVEIAWVNGNKALIKVPEYVTVAEKQPVRDVNVILASNAYDGGFVTSFDKLSQAVWGVTMEEATNFLMGTLITEIASKVPGVPTAKKGYDLVCSVIKKYEDLDLSKISIVTKVRIRSQVVIDSTGGDVKVYNIEGSPEVSTADGQEVTLEEGEMVRVENGTMSGTETFNPEEDLEEWAADLEPTSPTNPDTTDTEKEVPGWFQETFPFLMPLIDPILPLVPEPLIEILPFIVLGLPIILIILAISGMSRTKNKKRDKPSEKNSDKTR